MPAKIFSILDAVEYKSTILPKKNNIPLVCFNYSEAKFDNGDLIVIILYHYNTFITVWFFLFN